MVGEYCAHLADYPRYLGTYVGGYYLTLIREREGAIDLQTRDSRLYQDRSRQLLALNYWRTDDETW